MYNEENVNMGHQESYFILKVMLENRKETLLFCFRTGDGGLRSGKNVSSLPDEQSSP